MISLFAIYRKKKKKKTLVQINLNPEKVKSSSICGVGSCRVYAADNRELDYDHEIIKASDLMKMNNSAEKSNKTAESDSSSETRDTLFK